MINKVLRFKDGSEGLYLKQGVSAEMMGWTKKADEVTVKRAKNAREEKIYNDKGKPIGGKALIAYKVMIEGGGVEEIMTAIDRDRKSALQYMSTIRQSNKKITFPCDVKPTFTDEQLKVIDMMENGYGVSEISKEIGLKPSTIQSWIRYIRVEKGDAWAIRTMKRKGTYKTIL